jgi:CDP-glycerol glycerophosphotransferase
VKKLSYKIFAFIWQLFDFLIPKRKYTWAFATHHLRSTRFIENQRAVFEFVKSDSQIKKVIFYRNSKNEIDIDGTENIELVRQGSLRAFYLLLLCKVVFITHSISMDYSIRFGKKDFVILKVNLKKRIVVNLWHGIAIKRLLYAANEKARKHTDRMYYRHQERKYYAGLIASSDIDSLVMAAMFYPLNYLQIWTTGLPRNDFLLLPLKRLPQYIRKSIQILRSIKNGKRLVVYAPTYRQTDISESAYYYQFRLGEIKEVRNLLSKHNAILGYRPHYFRNSTEYFNLDDFIDNETIFNISQPVIPEFSAIARECDVLITDYSSVAIEALYLDKPILSFAYDIDNYETKQDGLIYDLSMVFAGNVYNCFDELLNVLDKELTQERSSSCNNINKNLFFNHQDCSNSQRVVERVKRLVEE